MQIDTRRRTWRRRLAVRGCVALAVVAAALPQWGGRHAAASTVTAPAVSTLAGDATALVGMVIFLTPGERLGETGSGSYTFSTGLGTGSAYCVEGLVKSACTVSSSGTRFGDLCTRGSLSGSATFDDGDAWAYSVAFVGGRGVVSGTANDVDGTVARLTGVVTVTDSPLAVLANENDCGSEALQPPGEFIEIDGVVQAGP